MKKVGIISLYYNSKNYGGLLQAYALNKYISELGYDSELISYKRENIKPLYLPPQQTKMQKLVKMGISEVVWRLYSKAITRFFAKKYGLLIGGSAGGVLFKALEDINKKTGSGNAVVLLCDGGEKYLNNIFNDDFMIKNELIDLGVEDKLDNWLVK